MGDQTSGATRGRRDHDRGFKDDLVTQSLLAGAAVSTIAMKGGSDANLLFKRNAEIKRRTNIVRIFPNDTAIVRLMGAVMLEQNDEWSLNRRYMQLEGGCKPSAILVCLGCPQWPSESRALKLSSGCELAPCAGT